MLAHHPKIARQRDRRDRRFRGLVLAFNRAGAILRRAVAQQVCQISLAEAEQVEVVLLGEQFLHLLQQHCLVPSAQLG